MRGKYVIAGIGQGLGTVGTVSLLGKTHVQPSCRPADKARVRLAAGPSGNRVGGGGSVVLSN
jgi:hypothetical protein